MTSQKNLQSLTNSNQRYSCINSDHLQVISTFCIAKSVESGNRLHHQTKKEHQKDLINLNIEVTENTKMYLLQNLPSRTDKQNNIHINYSKLKDANIRFMIKNDIISELNPKDNICI